MHAHDLQVYTLTMKLRVKLQNKQSGHTTEQSGFDSGLLLVCVCVCEVVAFGAKVSEHTLVRMLSLFRESRCANTRSNNTGRVELLERSAARTVSVN